MDKYITKAELRIDPYNINHEKVDNKYLEAMQQLTYSMVNNFCQTVFESEGTALVPVEYLSDGNEKPAVFVKRGKRLITLLKVRIYQDETTYLEYDPTNFTWEPSYVEWKEFTDRTLRTIVPDGYFPEGRGNIGILGIWGWSAVPEPIKYLQGRLIQKLIEDKSFAEKFMSETAGDYSYGLNPGGKEGFITGDFELDVIIKQYRRTVFYGCT